MIDEFLHPDALYNNLIEKKKKYGRLVIACDFDRTLYDSNDKGATYEMVRQLIRNLYMEGHFIMIFTGNQDIQFVRTFLFEIGVPYDSINEDAPFIQIENIGRKPYFNVLLDDRAGLVCTYKALNKFLIETRLWKKSE